jgi:hypothetical protein
MHADRGLHLAIAQCVHRRLLQDVVIGHAESALVARSALEVSAG